MEAETTIRTALTAGGTAPAKLVYRIGDVVQVVGLSKTTIYALVAAGDFPRPVQMTGKAVGWRAADVAAWVAARPVVDHACA